MSENSLRWKARLGSLKALAALILLFAVIFLIPALGNLSVATSNPTEPQSVDISQLARNELGANQYVTVSGTAFYPSAYQKTSDGRVTEEYFFLFDVDTAAAILIQAKGTVSVLDSSEPKTITGLTHAPESELRNLILSDLPDIQSNGVTATADLYLGEDEKPPDIGASSAAVIGLGVVSALCLATFFFPGTVFGPRPVDSLSAATGDAGVKATGQFVQLASVQPSIQIGQGKRKFSNAVANVVPLENRRLMIYIHHILTTKTYGVTVNRRESDWGVFIDPANVIDIEPGKLYGWKDRAAVRLRYRDEAQKEQTLYVSFNHAAAQAEFAGLLRRMGFAVGSGEMPLL